jgi:hypothetical protein
MPKRFTFPTTGFSCMLSSHQCEATNRNGHRCRRRTVIGVGLCWNHLLSIKHLRIKESSVENSGLGLFAMNSAMPENAIVFKKGEMIIEYGGEDIDIEELNNRYQDRTAPYGVQKKKDSTYNDSACVRGIGSNANTQVGKQNARLGIGAGDIVKVYATKNIRNNTEIFLAYGNSYNKFEEHVTR